MYLYSSSCAHLPKASPERPILILSGRLSEAKNRRCCFFQYPHDVFYKKNLNKKRTDLFMKPFIPGEKPSALFFSVSA